MKNKFNVFMVIWCAGWILYSLFSLFVVSTFAAIFGHLICIIVQFAFGAFYALQAKEPFRNFYAKIKEILKK